MKKIVINTCFGGFGLSKPAMERLAELGCTDYVYDIKRDDARLVQVVEEMGNAADGSFAKLTVVTIPDDVVAWHIDEYDGREHVAENHRTWG